MSLAPHPLLLQRLSNYAYYGLSLSGPVRFYPRDTVLARMLAMAPCPSLCHKSVFYQKGRTDCFFGDILLIYSAVQLPVCLINLLTDGLTLVFGMEASFGQSYTVF